MINSKKLNTQIKANVSLVYKDTDSGYGIIIPFSHGLGST